MCQLLSKLFITIFLLREEFIIMKKAKTVSIPDNRIVDFETYMKLNDHAYKSSLFYVTTYNKNSFQIKEKLLEKGYVNAPIVVSYKDGHTEEYNIIEDTIERLVRQHIIDDEQYVINFIQNGLDSGKSLSSLKNKLYMNKIPTDMVTKILDSGYIAIDETDGLDRQATKITNSSSFYKLDKYKKQQKLLRSLATKGFKVSDIYQWIEDNPDSME